MSKFETGLLNLQKKFHGHVKVIHRWPYSTIGESPLHNHSRGTMNITGQLSTSVRGVFINSPNGAFASFENSATDWGNHGSQYLPRTVNFDASKGWTGSTSSVGGNGAHNNMQPYVAVYRWLRTA